MKKASFVLTSCTLLSLTVGCQFFRSQKSDSSADTDSHSNSSSQTISTPKAQDGISATNRAANTFVYSNENGACIRSVYTEPNKDSNGKLLLKQPAPAEYCKPENVSVDNGISVTFVRTSVWDESPVLLGIQCTKFVYDTNGAQKNRNEGLVATSFCEFAE